MRSATAILRDIGIIEKAQIKPELKARLIAQYMAEMDQLGRALGVDEEPPTPPPPTPPKGK